MRLHRVRRGKGEPPLMEGERLRLEGVGHLFWVEEPERSAELVRTHCFGRPSS